MIISEEEKDLARFCVSEALRQGASQARASLNKSVSDQCSLLDGETDKLSHSTDRSVYVDLYVDGRYGGYSTNRLDKESLIRFIARCMEATRLLERDALRCLPDAALCEKNALKGDEMGLYDSGYEKVEGAQRLALARAGLPSESQKSGEGWKLVSCENSYGDSLEEQYICDSNSSEMIKIESGFAISCDLTLETDSGKLCEAFSWDASPFLEKLEDPSAITAKALERAIAKMEARRCRGGMKKMVVEREAASTLFGPLLNALYGDAIYNGSSFLKDKLGEKVFSELLYVDDLPRSSYGHSGARLFDGEGCSTADRTLVAAGRIKNYLLNTYYAAKLGLERSCAGVSVPRIRPCSSFGDMPGRWDCDALVRKVRNGILVTGFNGGNCNATTGDFSYGVEGFRIRNGKVAEPVGEMLVTGNICTLWQNLLAAGNDPKEATRWLIPSLAFDKVCFAG